MTARARTPPPPPPPRASTHADHNRAAALLSIASNASLVLMKLVLGVVTGSVAVLSEAAHSASDLLASGIAFIAVRASARPADHDHPYGHEKAENLAAAIEGILVLVAGLVVAFEAVRRLVLGGKPIDHVELAIAVMLVSGGVNIVVSRRLRAVASRTGSPAIEGDAAHLSADIWTSLSTAAALVVVMVTGWEAMDAIIAIAVAGYVTYMGVRLTHRAAQMLLDRTLPEPDLERIEALLEQLSVDGVSFHALRTRRAGSKSHIDLHMVVPPDTTVRRGHAMSGRVKGELCTVVPNADVLIHLEDR